MNRFLFLLLAGLSLFSSCSTKIEPIENFVWPSSNRVWVGPDFWANRLQDWRVQEGKLECIYSGPNRNLYVLTREIQADKGAFHLSVPIDFENTSSGWAGFRVGIEGQFDDYRDSAVRGTGLDAGITSDGVLFIGNYSDSIQGPITSGRELHLEYTKEEGLKIYTSDDPHEEPSSVTLSIEDIDKLHGGVALVSHFEQNELETSVRFGSFNITGDGIIEVPERRYGPVMFNQYTLSRGKLRYTAQLPPMGEKDDQMAYFQVKRGETWQTLAESTFDPLSRTATFTLDEWNSSDDIPYRVEYGFHTYDGKKERYHHSGVIRRDPVDKELVIAAFTGNNDLGFPNKDLTDNVKLHDPDFLFFSGDQIYEGVGGYGVERTPVDRASLDYLRKWYIFGWTYADLLTDRPAVSITDDHDVYHGNIWGANGIATPPGLRGSPAQDEGGYKMDPVWVNMVQRTQTSHLPDPYDPTPVEQDITVYYTDIVYGGVSFAVLEDRKFKSAPKHLLPEAEVDNGWAQNREWNAAESGDAEGAILLGERQELFLNDWVKDWSYEAKMKIVLSQTIFANVATLPEAEYHDAIVPRLRILEADEYPPDDRPVSDMDSNGWPQTPRNNALKILRKGFSFHIAGDQHLGSFIQYGVDDYRDAGFALCVPSVSNVWPRRWYPQDPGENREKGAPNYTGDFVDGFGNKMTVHAVSNPVFTGREPARLYDRATGYGIVKLNKDWRMITAECWPRDINPTEEGAQQYPGWPIAVSQLQSYSPPALGNLTEIQVDGETDPVFDVIDETTGELVYSLRIKGNSFQPFVFEDHSYTIRISQPDKGTEKVLEGMRISSSPLMTVTLE